MARQFDPLGLCGTGEDAVHRQEMIAQAAYFRSQRRGFQSGHEIEDWLAAEEEVNRAIAGSGPHAAGDGPAKP